jgi:hypothetical protein
MTNCADVVGKNFREAFRKNCVGKKVCDLENLQNILELNNFAPLECKE